MRHRSSLLDAILQYVRAFTPSLRAIAVLFLSGCSPGDNLYKDVVPPDAETIRQIEASAGADDLIFQTAEAVDGVSYGLIGDGVTDNTVAFKKLLLNGNRTIHIPAGDYVTGNIAIPSNTILVLDPGVTIRDSGQLDEHDVFIKILGENVRIEGLGAQIVSRRSDYTSGEHRHGIFIYGAHRVTIDGVASANHGGDGFFIGGPSGKPSTDVLLKGCRADNNRRQGLSITSARRVRVVDCEFTNTNGTAPQFGMDLEPDHPFEYLDNIIFLRPYTQANQGGGIMIYLMNLDASSYPVDVSIVEHKSIAESPPLYTRLPPEVNGIMRYSATANSLP